ncbi:MAG TPA: aminotransferase class III-fold pyridoxal phosphate-dependent enzyme, partial [Ignavibacteriaceae bacterium]
NEAAIKFARKFGEERTTIISAEGSFHGRTMGSLSASAQVKLWNGFRPLTPGFKYVPFNDVDTISHSITEDVCAIILEPIQGEGGIITPSPEYLKEVEKLCRENNLLLILDEVQTGMGRTGKFFAHQWFDVVPDIITLAKGIANGLPLGATIVSAKVADKIKPGDHGSTFGGNPLSIAAANAVVNLLTPETLTHISNSGKELMNELQKINSPAIKEIRGLGLIIGIEFDEKILNSTVVETLLNKKILTYSAGRNTMRLLPPYIINKNHISQFMLSFSSMINDLHLD